MQDPQHDDETEDAEGDRRDRDRRAGLPPGSSTKGDPDSRLRGTDRDQEPFEDAPAQGRLAPDGDNPPP